MKQGREVCSPFGATKRWYSLLAAEIGRQHSALPAVKLDSGWLCGLEVRVTSVRLKGLSSRRLLRSTCCIHGLLRTAGGDIIAKKPPQNQYKVH